MRIIGPAKSIEESKGFYVIPYPHTHGNSRVRLSPKWIGLVIVMLFASNLVTYSMFGNKAETHISNTETQSLYLLEEAGRYVRDIFSFENKVREVAHTLDVPPEWLMAVMYSESRFDPAVSNKRGSGAVGLIQFMVPTVKELNVRMGTKLYMKDIKTMSAHRQLDLVFEYLQTVRERYGEFDSLTDLYLAILYPRAVDQDLCYSLYAKPTRAYRQNSGLDENGDGSVTVSDIDRRMKRLFPNAYIAEK